MGKNIYAERQCDVLRCTRLEGENYGHGNRTVILEGIRRESGFPLTQSY